MSKDTYCVHYTEIGHGKRIKGKIYNGLKSVHLKALDEANAVEILRSRYSPGAIKEIRGVELVPDEVTQLRELLRDYYDAVLIGAKLEDVDLRDYEQRMSALQQRAEILLGLSEEKAS